MKEGASSQPRPRPGATRCPFCHEECEAVADACVCRDCLARHHARCWSESGACASCRGRDRLVTPEKPATAAREPQYGTTIDAWLRLAVLYNSWLAFVTVVSLNKRLLDLETLVVVLFGAVAANLLFLIGPAIEIFARRFGYRGDGLRWLIFLGGWLIASALTLLSCTTVW